MADSSDKPKRPRLPRDAGGSMELREGTGGITAACPCGDFVEIFKEDVTFRMQTPEGIDPDRSNPNAPFVASVSDNVGSSSKAVARVLLQGHEILKAAIFTRNVDTQRVTLRLHTCKEALVVCEKVSTRVAAHVDKIVAEIKAAGVKTQNRGRVINPFPQVPELDSEATTFLIHAKRSIEAICRLVPEFLEVPPKDNNFDDLAKTILKSGVSENAPLAKFIAANQAEVRAIIDLRNFQEHPGERRTIVKNFSVLPDGRIAVPHWHVSGQTARAVGEDMLDVTRYLIETAESMLLHLVMHSISPQYGYVLVATDDLQLSPNKPIKYRLSIDVSKLRPRE